MKIKEIITEATTWQQDYTASQKSDRDNESPAKVEQFYAFVEQNCEPFLNQIGGIQNLSVYEMYHGTNVTLNPAQLLKVRQHRTPVDTPEDTQDLIDDWFQQHTGVRFRESSVFATGDPSIAESYGSLALIIPVSEFNYAWSPVYDDLTSSLERFLNKNRSKRRDAEYDIDDMIYTDKSGMEFSRKDVTNPALINKFMGQGRFKFNTGLREAINQKHEIMINSKQIIIVSSGWIDRVSNQQ